MAIYDVIAVWRISLVSSQKIKEDGEIMVVKKEELFRAPKNSAYNFKVSFAKRAISTNSMGLMEYIMVNLSLWYPCK